MFDVGQHVICVRKKPWMDPSRGFQIVGGPAFLEECIVTGVFPPGHNFGFITVTDESIAIRGWNDSVFCPTNFRPKEPNIEALRSLLTDLPAPSPINVKKREDA